MKARLLFILIYFTACSYGYSQIILPPIIGDNMILQQESEVNLWGKSEKKSTVNVTTSWDNANYQTTTDSQGNWLVKIRTSSATDNCSITITDGESLTINNILIGDVWYCSGQSNMEMQLQGMTASQPIAGANEAILKAVKNKKMRIFTVNFGPDGEGENKAYTGKWEIVDSATAAEFSAIGYFFGSLLSEVLDIPLGMICSAKGGTRIEQWSNKIDLDTFLPHELNQATEGNSGLYGQLVKPISQYKIKGFLWYQGESNWESNPSTYGRIFEKMINRWRSDWHQGDLPFYFVEVAPMENYASVELREEQYTVAKTVPFVGMASSIDVGEQGCIHPSQKEIIAKRLAYIALNKTYGFSGLRSDNPSFKEYRINEDGKIWIEFDNAEFGFSPRNNIEGFEIAGADKVFKPIKADAVYIRELDKNFIQIDAKNIENPQYLQYCYHPWVKGTLYNTFGLPVLAFSKEINTKK